MADGNPLDPGHLIGHVKDATYFEVPRAISPDGSGKLHLPQPLKTETPIIEANPTLHLEAFDLKLTKFMVLEVVAAIIIAIIFIILARRLSGSVAPRGRLTNMFESMLVFIRDQVARPAIGHDADRFLPFLWTMFFFVLVCNLLGMVPWLGSATGALGTTLALAGVTMLVVVGAGMASLGVIGFFLNQIPPMELPHPAMTFLMRIMIFFLEMVGFVIKHGVLAVRLVANMFAGHIVLAVIIAFIAAVEGMLWWGVAPASIAGGVAIGLLEVFVAFLQAFVFTYLSALFIGMAVHPH